MFPGCRGGRAGWPQRAGRRWASGHRPAIRWMASTSARMAGWMSLPSRMPLRIPCSEDAMNPSRKQMTMSTPIMVVSNVVVGGLPQPTGYLYKYHYPGIPARYFWHVHAYDEGMTTTPEPPDEA